MGWIAPQRHPDLWLLLGLVLATAVTRWMTRRIRAKEQRNEKRMRDRVEDVIQDSSDGIIKNVVIAGIHIHHQVWGMLLCLVVGLLVFTYSPTGPPLDVLAFLFGVGTALVLDEFAMWLHLEDVYWANEGRTSISALIVAAAITAAFVLGADPLEVVGAARLQAWSTAVVVVGAAVNFALTVVCILKGKLSLGLVALVVPGLGLVGAVRLAKPGSWWARRYYPPGSRRDERSRRRFGPDYVRRMDALRDFIGGAHGR